MAASLTYMTLNFQKAVGRFDSCLQISEMLSCRGLTCVLFLRKTRISRFNFKELDFNWT